MKHLIDFIREQHPKEVAEFDAAPWDYRVYGSLNLDEDEAKFVVYLYIGKEKAEKQYTFDVVLETVKVNDVTIRDSAS